MANMDRYGSSSFTLLSFYILMQLLLTVIL